MSSPSFIRCRVSRFRSFELRAGPVNWYIKCTYLDTALDVTTQPLTFFSSARLIARIRPDMAFRYSLSQTDAALMELPLLWTTIGLAISPLTYDHVLFFTSNLSIWIFQVSKFYFVSGSISTLWCDAIVFHCSRMFDNVDTLSNFFSNFFFLVYPIYFNPEL